MNIDQDLIDDLNEGHSGALDDDYEALGAQLARRGIAIDRITEAAAKFRVALPSWAVGTGGTRFARFPGPGEPRNIFDKLDDCAVVQQLVRNAPNVALHIPWDKADDLKALKEKARRLGLGFDAINSNTFQDPPGSKYSYKFGSLSHVDAAVRRQAIEHNLECIEIGQALGVKALSVWIGDGSNFPGQSNLTRAFERYLDSVKKIAKALPRDWHIYLEYKLYEPAFYATVVADWGSAYLAAVEVGPQALCLVDLGHHAHGTNIEMIVARLIQFGKLGGFHINDSKYGDDDLDAGSINPYQLFLVFNELVDAAARQVKGFRPSYLLDQSHNLTDPIESLIASTIEVARAYVQALIVERDRLDQFQRKNDAMMATQVLKRAFLTDVSPILARARRDAGGAIDPIGAYRASRYREKVAKERPAVRGTGGGIV
jgi:L-rhamnose isomerase/sugar isomerase